MSGGIKMDYEKVGDMDEFDLNSFTIRPDALIYFTISKVVGLLPKGIEQNRSVEDIHMIRSLLVDDLEDLCEAQKYIHPEGAKLKNGDLVNDPYYDAIVAETKKLGLDKDEDEIRNFWELKSKLARKKFKLLTARVFGSTVRGKELEY